MGLRWKYLLIAVALTALDLWVAFRYGAAVWQAYSDFLPVRLLLVLFVAVWITSLADLWSRAIYRLREAPRARRVRLVNRLAYGIQRDKPLPDGTFPYVKQKRPLDLDALRMHLNADITINLYAINPQTQRSKWVAIDADYEGSLEALFQLQWELKQDGVEAALEQSRRGGHLWVLGERPLLASQCRIYIYNLALRLGVPVKGAGLREGIEVFPRQDAIEPGAYGNAIRGPLGVHRKSNRRYWFYEADLNPEAQLAYLEGLKKLTVAELEALTQGMYLPRAYRPPDPEPFIAQPAKAGRQEFRILDYVRTTGKQDGRNWKAQCPSCAKGGRDRSRNNLGIKISDSRFYVCRAGCTKEDIREALGQPVRRTLKA